MKMKKYEHYRNPDKRCHYPWEPVPVGYCWGYAGAFDVCKTKKELKKKTLKFCLGCEFWKDKNETKK